MLDHLGIPCLQAAGEAEAMCAMLNKRGIVDACVTKDGDVFLYGALQVVKSFNITAKTQDPQIECYSRDDIETKLGLDNDKLIAFGLIVGCDYTEGVSNIGHKKAMMLLNSFMGVNVLERFRECAEGRMPEDHPQEVPAKGPHCTKCTHEGAQKDHRANGCAMCNSNSACLQKTPLTPKCTCSWHVRTDEASRSSKVRDIMNKVCGATGFPDERVIAEFKSEKDECPEKTPTWRRPDLVKTKTFMRDKMEWKVQYAVEKVFPLVTLWDMRDIASGHPVHQAHLTPATVVKRCIRQDVACVEIQWHKQDWMSSMKQENLTTIEKKELFAKAFPDKMRVFEKAAKPSKKEKWKKEKKKDDLQPKISSFFQKKRGLDAAEGDEEKKKQRKQPAPSTVSHRAPDDKSMDLASTSKPSSTR